MTQEGTKRIKIGSDDDILSQKISNQIGYYFSDINIVKDKFLLQEIQKDEGWIKLATLLTFARLKTLTTDQSRVIEALKAFQIPSVELDESNTKLRRKTPIPKAEDINKDLDSRTVHISGFPSDYQFEELDQFCRKYGKVESLSMRRFFHTRLFKGCVHVVYEKEEDSKKVLAEENLKCKDRDLRIESMEQYHKRKAEMLDKRKQARRKRKSEPKKRDYFTEIL